MYLPMSTFYLTFLLATGCEVFKFDRPVVSDSVLFQMLTDIWNASGLAVSGDNLLDRAVIKNRNNSFQCLGMLNNLPTDYNNIVSTLCLGSIGQLVWIRNAGSGYVSIVFQSELCMGSGYDVGSVVHVSQGDQWCKDSKSHRFAMILIDKFVQFKQAENELCLTVAAGGKVIVKQCDPSDKTQHWVISQRFGKTQWPQL